MSEENQTNSVEQEQSVAVQLSGFLGKKLGMTQIFNSQGERVPVTVISLPTQFVTEVKTAEKHGYEAVQVAAGP